jgi:tetratricopeptide (TPR) repeat protein
VANTLEEIARAAYALGQTFKADGQLDQAEVCFTEALTLARQGLGATDPLLPALYAELVYVAQARGDLPAAEAHLRNRIALLEEQDDYDGEGLNQLAHLAAAQGRGSEGVDLLKRALELKEDRLGPDHFDVAMRLGDLADLQEARGEWAEARPVRERMIVLLANHWGPFDPQLPPVLEKLAVVCDQLDDPATARSHRQTADEIRARRNKPRN